MARPPLPPWAARYGAIPWREHGRDHAGCDCWGLYRLILGEQTGIWLPSHDEVYARALDGHAVAAAVACHGTAAPEWNEVPAGAERTFDAVLMRLGYPRDGGGAAYADAHVAMVLVPGFLIHIEADPDGGAGAGVTVRAYRDDIRINRRVRQFYRHAGLS